MFRFQDPSQLWWLTLVGILAIVMHFLFLRKLSKAQRFIASQLWSSGQLERYQLKERLIAGMLLGATIFAILALARPQWGEREEEVKRNGLDIMVAVDVSKSMLTRDIRPSRLERTQWAIKDLVKKLNGDRIGLIAFAGEAFVMCPLTIDYNGFLTSVDDLSPAVIPRGGTDISKAIEEAIKSEGKSAGHYQALVLVTDGEDLEGDVMQAARKAKEKGLKIFTVGVGSQEGDLIEVVGNDGNKEFLKDASGNVVKSRLNERLLQSIAFETQGAYVRSSATEFGLDFLYEKQLSLIPKQDRESKQSKQYIDRFQWPLTLALILLIISIGVIDRRIIASVILIVLVGGISTMAYAKDVRQWVNEGTKAYKKGDFQQAVDAYQNALDLDPQSPRVHYNLGTALYKNNEYAQAIAPLTKATQTTKSPVMQPAFYNLANSQLRQGLLTEEQSVDEAINLVTQSIAHYDQALMLDGKDQMATKNKAIAQKELERLKEKKKQQQEQKDKQQSKDGKQDKENSKEQDQKQESESKQHEENKEQQESSKDKQKDDSQKQSEGHNKQQEKSKEQQAQEDKGKKQDNAQEKQAKEILADYQRNEEPKGMLYLIDKKSSDNPVTKDW